MSSPLGSPSPCTGGLNSDDSQNYVDSRKPPVSVPFHLSQAGAVYQQCTVDNGRVWKQSTRKALRCVALALSAVLSRSWQCTEERGACQQLLKMGVFVADPSFKFQHIFHINKVTISLYICIFSPYFEHLPDVFHVLGNFL